MKTRYELGYIAGYFGNLVMYPEDKQYMAGYEKGYQVAEKEYYDTLPDDITPCGTNDAHFDCHYT